MDAHAIWIPSNFSSTTGYAWKFIYRVQSVVARTMRERGVRVVLSFARIEGPITTLDSDIEFDAFEFDPMNITPASALRLYRSLRRQRVRYAYLTDMPTYHWVYAVMRLAGVRRIVSHSHVSVASPHPPPPERGLRGALKALVSRTPMGADAVYAVSEFVAQRLRAKARYPTSRTFVIRYGIDLSRFACEEQAPSKEPVRVFIAARATKVKGVQVLIEAVGRLGARKDLPPFVVRYAGDGPDLQYLRDVAHRSGVTDRFIFLGALADTLSELCAADVVVVPSIWGDASPLAAIEALAAGKPLLATSAGGLPEIVGDESAGIVVSPEDVEALANALARLLDNPALRATMGRAARSRAHARYQQSSFHEAVSQRILTDLGFPDRPPGSA